MNAGRIRVSPYDAAAILLGVLATGISAYLTVVHYQEDLLVCQIGGCETVQSSKYAEIGPIPVAVLGLLSSLVMLGLAIARVFRTELVVSATVALFGMTLMAALYELYLTYVEIWVLEAICQWCVAYAIVIVIWLSVESVRLWRDVLSIDDLE